MSKNKIILYDSALTTEIGELDHCIKCLVTEENNGVFELEMTYLIIGAFLEHLDVGQIIKVKANEELQEQLFRIYYVSNELNGRVMIRAEHISYDLRNNFVESVYKEGITCTQAFELIFSNCEFSHNFKGYSDITHTGTVNLSRVNALEAIKGTVGSLLDTFGNGGKIVRDNFNVFLLSDRGYDRGVTIAYAKNLLGYTREIDTSEVITAIYPYTIFTPEDSEKEELLTLPEKFIYSEKVNDYPQPRILAVDYSSENVTTIDALRSKATSYFKNTGNDEAKVNYSVEFVPLHKTTEYKTLNLIGLEDVYMGDTVTIEDKRIGMLVKARVIKTVFNVLTDRFESIELGNFKESIDSVISNMQNNINNTSTQIQNIYSSFAVANDSFSSITNNLEQEIKKTNEALAETNENVSNSTQKSNIIATINASSETEKINSSKVSLNDYVTKINLTEEDAVEINGSNITLGIIQGLEIFDTSISTLEEFITAICQSLQDEITAREEEIALLDAKVTDLEERITTLESTDGDGTNEGGTE